MKTESVLNNDILEIIGDIKKRFPELLKYIEEMPVTIPNKVNPQINIKILADYYTSLIDLRDDYALTHGGSTNKPIWRKI